MHFCFQSSFVTLVCTAIVGAPFGSTPSAGEASISGYN